MYLGEPEIQAKRKVLAVLMDESRKSVDAIRELARIMSSNEDPTEPYTKLQEIALDVKGNRRALTRSLIELGEMVINKEDIMRVAYQIESLTDILEGTGFRIKEFRGKGLEKAIRDPDLMSLLEKDVEMVIKTNEMIRMLQLNPEKVSEMLPNIESLEKEVDDLYRQALIKIYDSVKDSKLFVVLKDIIERLDAIADTSLSVADNIVIVSMGI